MRKQDHLLALLHTLTPSEKKYFVQTATAGGQKPKYLNLYELLLQKKEYNATDLALKTGKSKAAIANDKKYLEQVLLRSLRLFHENCPKSMLFNELTTNNILQSKGLHDYVRERLQKMREQPGVKNDSIAMIRLCTLEIETIVATKPYWLPYANDMQHLYKLAISYSNKCLIEQQIDLLLVEVNALKLTYLYADHPAIRKKVQQLLNNPVLKQPLHKRELTRQKYNILSGLHSMLRHFNTSIHYSEKATEMLREDLHKEANGEQAFFTQLDVLVQFCISSGNYTKARKWMARIDKRYYKTTARHAAWIDEQLRWANVKNKIFMTQKMLTDGQITTAKAQAEVKEWNRQKAAIKGIMPDMSYIATLCNAAKIELLCHRPSEGIDQLNELIHHTPQEINPVAQCTGRIFFLLAHYELGNESIIPSLLGSTQRFIEKNNHCTEVEAFVFKSIRQLLKTRQPRQQHDIFHRLKQSCYRFIQKPETAMRVSIYGLQQWIERIENAKAHTTKHT